MTAPARRILLLGLLLALAGCATVTNYFEGGASNLKPPTPLTAFTPKFKVKQLWQRQVGSGTGSSYRKLAPALWGKVVYADARDGVVAAFDAVSGKRLWAAHTDAPLSTGPGLDRDHVYLGTSKGEVIALARADGKRAWRVWLSSEVLATPVAADGVVVARTIDGRIYGLSAADGKRLWVYDSTVPLLTLRGASTPAISHGGVIAGLANGKVVVLLLKTGQKAWETTLAVPQGQSELQRLVDIETTPVVVGRVVYVASYHGRVAALELRTGTVIWARKMSTDTNIAVGPDNLYVSDTQGRVWALDRQSGATVWRQDKLEARRPTAPSIYRDGVVVGDYAGYVHWMSREDGAFVARTRVDGGAVVSAPLIRGNVVYVYTAGGTLSALLLLYR